MSGKAKLGWQERVAAFAEAVAIGIDVYSKHGPPPDEDGLSQASVDDYTSSMQKLVDLARNAEPPFANLKSLAYLEDSFFTFWNEANGPAVTAFWTVIAERKLPFERKDVVRDVLTRGRIRTRIEYEHVTDGILGRRFSPDEQQKLGEMLESYEGRDRRRKK